MHIRTAGTDWRFAPLPLSAPEGNEGSQGADGAEGKPADGDGGEDTGFVFDATKAYEGLEADNLEWLHKNEGLLGDPKALAKHAFNQEKLIGSSIRVPGKDATQEERDAFLNKLGRPETADKYELSVPKEMPEGLPYDGEFAKRATSIGHKLGLTQEQMAGLHDFWVGEQVAGFKTGAEAGKAALEERATKAVDTLEKLWGPLDGQTAQANLEIADKVFTQTKGGSDFLAALQELNLVGPNKEILDARIAPFVANLGMALYTEDGVLRGNPAATGNPFDEKAPEFNVTEQMKLAKENPAKALSLIHAAGKKPEDFGLKANFGA